MESVKKATLLLFFSAIQFAVFSQLQPVYNFWKDDSLLKKNYYEESVKKKNYLVSSLGKENRDDYKKIYEERLKQIKELILSSRTVTDTAVQNYLLQVIKKITDANPVLKNIDARVVFTRDWWPNAYSIGDGTIVVNAGLMVYLGSEAELAFVLCHELAHYYLKHSEAAVVKYVETVNSTEFQKELKRLSKEEYKVNAQLENLSKKIVFDNRRHSRDKEAEADMQGFQFFRRTGYDGFAIKSTLLMLDKVDDTSFYKPLNLQQVFSFPEYPFKTKWIKKESAIFSGIGDDDISGLTKQEKDSLKTHPDCVKRIALLEDSINIIRGRNYLVNEKQFNRLKNDFIAELTEQCFQSDNLSRNLYLCLQMLQEEKNIPLAIYSVGRALNVIYEQQKAHKLGQMTDVESKFFPEDYNLLLRMLDKIRLDEIAALSYNFCTAHYGVMKGYEGFEEEMNKARKHMN
jgi:hypothetical protein